MYKIILLLDFAEEYSKCLLKGISKYSAEHGHWSFCRMPLYYRETLGVKGILNWAKDWKAHGIIGQLYNEMENDLYQSPLPMIAQDFKERFRFIPNITGQYRETGKLGAEYFLNKGYTQFAFYGFKNIVWSRERAEGFESTVNQAGFHVHYFEHKKARSTDLWYYKSNSLSKWLKSLPKPIALMACDDNQGVHITEACKQNNIRVPQEVAVLGVDNDVMLCELSDPPLSSIELDIERAGYDTARAMDLMITGRVKFYRDILVPPLKVVTRNSTDIYASQDNYVATVLDFIHKNIDQNLLVDQIVKEVPMSRRSLEKRFLEVTGYPVYKYIFKLRIEKLAQKLVSSELSVFEIALEMGFPDSKNISRQFRQVMGCTPVEYRKRAAEKIRVEKALK
ncbi:DNA-binding transcriptional regulator [Algoriphagus sp.]|jgi:LacI family transcriptional regulator|uniref:AraC family transcriptional regulator n=1 Tax=Algoriphagus sp. TaxID=1872435 RepID=UPI002715E3F3|nr:DNA-binding transcriptional regulator [Algoriphagus sp.]MDO8966063.1 DNA-binding transcriptional regulator [Algoriphagus sp.]MDP3199260.1 DNA-binding transcriptional regulator [Algoriphagus sp.]